MTTLEAVFWDLDGTLIDGERLWATAHAEVAHELGGHFEQTGLHELAGVDLDTSVRAIMRATAVEDPTLVRKRLLTRVRELYELGVAPLPGARAALESVRRCWPMALVTATWREHVELALDALGRPFETEVCGDEVARNKPDPEPYRVAAERLGVLPRRCVAIEDSPTGVLSAERAGCQVLVVPGSLAVLGGARRAFRPSLLGLRPGELSTLLS